VLSLPGSLDPAGRPSTNCAKLLSPTWWLHAWQWLHVHTIIVGGRPVAEWSCVQLRLFVEQLMKS
jgi:hypothetical protein